MKARADPPYPKQQTPSSLITSLPYRRFDQPHVDGKVIVLRVVLFGIDELIGDEEDGPKVSNTQNIVSYEDTSTR